MKRVALSAALVLLSFVGCQKQPTKQLITPVTTGIRYQIDLTQRGDDLFRVSMFLDEFDDESLVIQFPASAPGTYQTMDIGRYVRDFKVTDVAGNAVVSEQINVNQWRVNSATGMRIDYTIAETWDTHVDENRIFRMAGTSLEDDHTLICPHAVFAFPLGYQERPVSLQMILPDTWQVGTALALKDGTYHADDYDQFVDSPILAGRLSIAEETIDGCRFGVYVYSTSGEKQAQEILDQLRPVIEATSQMLNGFPNDHYDFLFHFADLSMGAWEHAYSSNYVLSDTANQTYAYKSMVHMAAHEVFHMITPLHIHSEMIDPFDFQSPKPSKHLWFYEGVTEWAARIMMLRSGHQELEHYLKMMTRSIMTSAFFNPEVSLTELGEMSFSKEGQALFGNIYMKGALTAALLDLEILHVTNGKMGLRELILGLANDFGPQRAFSEADFFDEISRRSAPEVKDFLLNYIEDIQPLPIGRCFDYVGIDYDTEKGTFSVSESPTSVQLALRETWLKHISL